LFKVTKRNVPVTEMNNWSIMNAMRGVANVGAVYWERASIMVTGWNCTLK
jgi:hypothetical protein